MSRLIRISKLAKDLGVTTRSLYNWHRLGALKFIVVNKMNYVDEDTYNGYLHIKKDEEEKVIIYCRVSSTSNRSNLETQKERLVNYCMAKGYNIYKVIEEIGSGINDQRAKLIKVLKDNEYTKIVVEHKDRLTRFGFNYLDILTRVMDKRIEVVNNMDSEEENIIQDFVSIITSYCAKIYGKRRSKRKTEQLIKELQKD